MGCDCDYFTLPHKDIKNTFQTKCYLSAVTQFELDFPGLAGIGWKSIPMSNTVRQEH